MKLFGSKSLISPQQREREKANAAFFKAIGRQDIKAIENILHEYPDAMNWKNDDDRGALYHAIYKNAVKSLLQLISHIPLEKNLSFYTSLLEYAARKERHDIAFLLIERGAPIKGVPDYTHKIQIMLKHAEKIRAEYLAQETVAPTADKAPQALFDAIDKKNKADIANIAKKYPGLFEWRDGKGQTPMFRALSNNNLYMFRYMLSLGADINEKAKESGNSPHTLLHQAIYDRRASFVSFLLDNGADPKIRCGWCHGHFDDSFSYNGNYAIGALQLAENISHFDIANLIRQKTIDAKPLKPREIKESRELLQERYDDLAKSFNILSKKQEETEILLRQALRKIDKLEQRFQAPKTIEKNALGRAEP